MHRTCKCTGPGEYHPYNRSDTTDIMSMPAYTCTSFELKAVARLVSSISCVTVRNVMIRPQFVIAPFQSTVLVQCDWYDYCLIVKAIVIG
jgi:hypothetical protein